MQNPDVYPALTTEQTMNVFSESAAQKILQNSESASVASHFPKMDIALPVYDAGEDVLLESANDHSKLPVSSTIEFNKSRVPNK